MAKISLFPICLFLIVIEQVCSILAFINLDLVDVFTLFYLTISKVFIFVDLNSHLINYQSSYVIVLGKERGII